MPSYTAGYKLGYVVLEWNQASAAPRVLGDVVWHEIADAVDVRDQARAETARVGRGEHHTIAVLVEPEDSEVSP